MEASFCSTGVRGATKLSAAPVSWESGAGRALRSTLPLGVRGRDSSATKAEGTRCSGSVCLSQVRSGLGIQPLGERWATT